MLFQTVGSIDSIGWCSGVVKEFDISRKKKRARGIDESQDISRCQRVIVKI